jgi:hypothetical protein
MLRPCLVAVFVLVSCASTPSNTDGGPTGGGSATGGGTGGGGAPPPSETVTDQSLEGFCWDGSGLEGTVAAGDACTHAEDCAPTCCDCRTGKSFLAGACLLGHCASHATACETLTDVKLCGVDDGGVFDAGVWSPTAPDGGVQHVAGSQWDCQYQGHGRWDADAGSCVVPSTLACVDGDFLCALTSGRFTGKQCCFDAPVTCVASDSTNCLGAGVEWTGTECCLHGQAACATETSSAQCTAGTWLGTECCVTGATTCTDQVDAFHCSVDLHGTWTGTHCCH